MKPQIMSTLLNNPTVQSFLLREKRLVAVAAPLTARASVVEKASRKALLAEVAQFGFTLSGAVLSAIEALPAHSQRVTVGLLVSTLREICGAAHKYVPLFKNFPHDVPQDEEYLLKRIVGYLESLSGPLGEDYTTLTCGHIVNHRLFDLDGFGACPICQHQVPGLSDRDDERKPLTARQEWTALKMIDLARGEDVWTTWSNLAGAKTSLSASQKEFLVTVARAEPSACEKYLPASLPFKENAAVVLAALFKAGVPAKALLAHIKTATDVLRLGVALCGGDVSLAEPCLFKLTNGERKFLLAACEQVRHDEGHMAEEMVGWRERWLRLGKAIHPGEHLKRFPKTAAAFDLLRNASALLQSRGSRIEQVMSNTWIDAKQGAAVLEILSERPGDLARRLDALVRKGVEASEVVAVFEKSAGGVATPTLLALIAHLRQRGEALEFRAFMPKGSLAKMKVVADGRDPMPRVVRMALIKAAEDALIKRFAERPALGKVFVDDSLASVLVPFSQRSASKGMSPMTRGSRVAFDDSKGFLRLFLNWKQTAETGTIDVDLSATLFDENWNGRGHLSWTRLSSYGDSVHSGDVRSASGPHGAAEFIDLDLQAFRKAGVRYVAVSVFSWTGQLFSAFPCYAGFMERDKPGKGRQFEPRTVKHRFEVTAAGRAAIPLLADLKTNEILWADMAMKGHAGAMVENSTGATVKTLKAIDQMGRSKTNLKDLFDLHVMARGQAVAERSEADLVIDESKVMELDDVVAQWL